MSTRVKICGITNLDDARFCAAQGADYLGFIQAPDSPRYIDPLRAREICEWVEGARSVGVFAGAPADEVARAVDIAQFDIIQLHGHEHPKAFRTIGRPIIKAIPMSPAEADTDIAEAVRAFEAQSDFLLFDSAVAGNFGGTGKAFDWSTLGNVHVGIPFFLAGGLGPDNVGDAIRLLRPYAVDASSRLEREPGNKDFGLVESFFRAIRSGDGQHNEN